MRSLALAACLVLASGAACDRGAPPPSQGASVTPATAAPSSPESVEGDTSRPAAPVEHPKSTTPELSAPDEPTFTGPSAAELKTMNLTEFWWWLIECERVGSDRSREAFDGIVRRVHADPERNEFLGQIFYAISTRMTEAEQAPGATAGRRATYDAELLRLSFLADGIEQALGDSSWRKRVDERRSLAPSWR